MTANVEGFANVALSKASSALHSVGNFSVEFASKAKDVTLLALSKIGEYLYFFGVEFAKFSKVAFNYGVIFGKFAGEKALQGGQIAWAHTYQAALLTKSLVLAYPQLFCGMGIGLGLGAIAVFGTYYLVK